MAIYAIGDIQGCYQEFQGLLDKIAFDPNRDYLWLTGDLVNRGRDSLAVLRLVMSLGDRVITVLGNHDLHLLAVAHGLHVAVPEDALQSVLDAPDLAEIIAWLRQQPLLHYDAKLQFIMVHAGLAPCWDLQQARQYADEVASLLNGDDYIAVLQNMYGDTPMNWNDSLQGHERIRYIINCFTRLRFCDANSRLDLGTKGDLKSAKPGYMPWFLVPNRKTRDLNVIFGHWASLANDWDTVIKVPHIYPMDSGCVWGNCLSALELTTQQRFSISCNQYKKV